MARWNRYCDGVSRRNVLKAGALGGFGLSLADLLRLEAAGNEASRGKSGIFLFLDGGQSHVDSWDMKPEAGETAGAFCSVATNLPGLEVCEHMPRLAQQAHRYTVFRGVEKAIAVHGRGMELVRSGNRPRASLKYPGLGSIVAKEHTSPQGVPPYVSLPLKVTNGTIETPGYLGVAYRSFAVKEDPNAEDFTVRALSVPEGSTAKRVARRRDLLGSIDNAFADVELADPNLDGMDRFYGQAFDILRSERTRTAFDLSREKDALRERYGRTSVGQACLLARRLVEAGVRCVTIDFGGWDTHQNNFRDLEHELLPPWDAALATLLEDLDERGLLESTVVWSTGEMGRTPKINDKSGRDHWGKAMSMLLAGGGIRGGNVIGQTDATGSEVVEDGHTPEDVAASVLHALGIDHTQEYYTPTGRPITLVRDGEVVEKLFA